MWHPHRAHHSGWSDLPDCEHGGICSHGHTGYSTQVDLIVNIPGSVTLTQDTYLRMVWLTPTVSMEGSGGTPTQGHFTQDGLTYPNCKHGGFWRLSHTRHTTQDGRTYPDCEHGWFWRHTHTGHFTQDGLTYPDCQHGGFWKHSHTRALHSGWSDLP